METYNTKPENPTVDDRADELCSMLDNVAGTDEIGYVSTEDSAIVSLWTLTESVDTVREVAKSEGFVEGGVTYQTDDGEETHISFDYSE